VPAGLHARLELICRLTGRSPGDALAEALHAWATGTIRDPVFQGRASAQLDAEEHALRRRRDHLRAVAGPAGDGSHPPRERIAS
jgi:hypothetical protein